MDSPKAYLLCAMTTNLSPPCDRYRLVLSTLWKSKMSSHLATFRGSNPKFSGFFA